MKAPKTVPDERLREAVKLLRRWEWLVDCFPRLAGEDFLLKRDTTAFLAEFDAALQPRKVPND